MTKRSKNVSDRNCNLCVVKNASDFGFGRRSDNVTDRFTLHEDGRVRGAGIVGAEREVSGDAAAGFGGYQVSSVVEEAVGDACCVEIIFKAGSKVQSTALA